MSNLKSVALIVLHQSHWPAAANTQTDRPHTLNENSTSAFHFVHLAEIITTITRDIYKVSHDHSGGRAGVAHVLELSRRVTQLQHLPDH